MENGENFAIESTKKIVNLAFYIEIDFHKTILLTPQIFTHKIKFNDTFFSKQNAFQIILSSKCILHVLKGNLKIFKNENIAKERKVYMRRFDLSSSYVIAKLTIQ